MVALPAHTIDTTDPKEVETFSPLAKILEKNLFH